MKYAQHSRIFVFAQGAVLEGQVGLCCVHVIGRIELAIPEPMMPMMVVMIYNGNGDDDDIDDEAHIPSPMFDKQLILGHPQWAAFVSGCQGWTY